ncbi:type VI secretion system protein TssR domain-containing protein [Tenacibaculum sp. SSH1-16]|uniref:type VI secretion system protein TssR domain-containing protein n=1 Tax=Tenacibaculum sp. SSH1-16 TaxID=3136667 RepID=UPI0032C4239C|nr:type VI secretion system protein TssR [Tenacibaculum mesophilum]
MQKKITLFIFLLLLYSFPIVSQTIGKYEKVKEVKTNRFNYLKKAKTKHDASLKMVFSDREENSFYKGPYVQEKFKKKGLLTPLYVIDEKENSYEVVVANPDQIGKPKGLFSMFYGDKFNFKDSEQVEYLGWIPASNVIEYNHSFLETCNNKPIKYKVGTDKTLRLFDLKPHMEVDSVNVFKDPFFRTKSNKKLVSNQIVYPYKYDEKGKAVFVSDKPVLKDSISQTVGWIPSNLITRIGQSQVYVINDTDSLLAVSNKDTIQLTGEDVLSKYLYTGYKNLKTDVTKDLIAPVHVWNHDKNKLINVKGNSFYTKEIKFMKEESKVVNFHFISKNEESEHLKKILNSLQSLYITLFQEPTEAQYSFSAILVDRKGTAILEKTSSFSEWISFVESFIESNQNNLAVEYVEKTMSIPKAVNYVIDNFSDENKRFENNFFIIASSKENTNDIKRQKDTFFEKIAKKSPKIIFAQLDNNQSVRSQNYILGSKEFLYKTGKYYNEFIKNFIVDNEIIVENNILKKIPADEDNIYVYDAPDNSLFNGGVIFPRIESSLTPLSLEKAIDTVLKRSTLTNNKLISSLNYFNKKLGVLRSEPSTTIKTRYKELNTDSLRLFQLSRNNLHEVLYQKVSLLNDSIIKKGYVLDKDEIIELIENYRSTFPQMAKPITRKKRRVIKRLYQKQIKILNKAAYRYVLSRKATIADLFYFKSGIPLNHEGYYCLGIYKLPRKRVGKNGFEKFYFQQYEKIDKLEELFLKNKLQKVEEGYRSEVYFIPLELLP